jgi:hypothetical protein
MRDFIARALARVLTLVLPSRVRRRCPGRHTAEYLAARTVRPPVRPVICTGSTPLPPHVLARTAPSPWGHRVPPYLRDWIRDQEAAWERQRLQPLPNAQAVPGHEVPFGPGGTGAVRMAVPA